MGNTSRTEIPAEISAFYDKNLLVRVQPLLIHTKFAQVRDLPKQAGTDTIKFRRYSNLAAATTALTEGITPSGSKLSVTDITAQVKQYGDYITVTDVVDYESQDMVLIEAGEILGDQAADTLDQLCRDVINAGTAVRYGGDATSRATLAAGDVATLTLVKAAVLSLKNNKCRKMTSIIDPNTGVNTTPINASYVGINHTNLSDTIRGFTGFVPVEKYPNRDTVMEGEYGQVNEVRFIETTNGKYWEDAGASSEDVYSILIFGQHAYGTTRVSGEAMKNIIKPLGSAGTADPLDQRATTGWKATFVTKILNNSFMERIEVTLT